MHTGISRAVRRGSVLALVVGGGALALPSVALANPPCGKVVTHNVTLNANMTCFSANGPFAALFVGKDGITINLNGFTIESNFNVCDGIDNAGDWPASAPGAGGTPGPGTGFNHDTVENGNVKTFRCDGIFVENTGSMKVSNMTVYDNDAGLALFDSNKASVTGSHFGIKNNGNCFGADMGGNAALTISSSSFNFNGCVGIDEHGGSQATLNGVKANHNHGDGAFVNSPAAYLIENSKANGNRGNGFEVQNNKVNTIKFTGNNAENNGGWGFFAEVFAKGTNNGYENDASGGCHHVGGCHLNP